MDTQELLSRVTRRIVEMQSSAHEHGITISEETITEFLVLELKRMGGKAVHIAPHAKHKEGKTGADLELIFVDPEGQLPKRYVVQAKRLYLSNRYEAIRKDDQFDKLMKCATVTDAEAVYLFYNHIHKENEETIRKTSRFKQNESVDLFGCTVFEAEIVHATKPRSFQSLHTEAPNRFCLLKDLPLGYGDLAHTQKNVTTNPESDSPPDNFYRARSLQMNVNDSVLSWNERNTGLAVGLEILPPRFVVAIATRFSRDVEMQGEQTHDSIDGKNR